MCVRKWKQIRRYVNINIYGKKIDNNFLKIKKNKKYQNINEFKEILNEKKNQFSKQHTKTLVFENFFKEFI